MWIAAAAHTSALRKRLAWYRTDRLHRASSVDRVIEALDSGRATPSTGTLRREQPSQPSFDRTTGLPSVTLPGRIPSCAARMLRVFRAIMSAIRTGSKGRGDRMGALLRGIRSSGSMGARFAQTSRDDTHRLCVAKRTLARRSLQEPAGLQEGAAAIPTRRTLCKCSSGFHTLCCTQPPLRPASLRGRACSTTSQGRECAWLLSGSSRVDSRPTHYCYRTATGCDQRGRCRE